MSLTSNGSSCCNLGGRLGCLMLLRPAAACCRTGPSSKLNLVEACRLPPAQQQHLYDEDVDLNSQVSASSSTQDAMWWPGSKAQTSNQHDRSRASWHKPRGLPGCLLEAPPSAASDCGVGRMNMGAGMRSEGLGMSRNTSGPPTAGKPAA